MLQMQIYLLHSQVLSQIFADEQKEVLPHPEQPPQQPPFLRFLMILRRANKTASSKIAKITKFIFISKSQNRSDNFNYKRHNPSYHALPKRNKNCPFCAKLSSNRSNRSHARGVEQTKNKQTNRR